MKTVELGGGIVVDAPNVRYRLTLEVVAIDEANQRVQGKLDKWEQWFPVNEIRDVIAPQNFALESALNRGDD